MSSRTVQAMILAAGRGQRMRPLTDSTPKPLLRVAGKPLIAWHLERLQAAGILRVVINTSWLTEQIHTAIGDGSQFGLRIRYSDEQPAPLETLGGLLRAMPHFGTTPFVLINGDVWSNHPLAELTRLQLPAHSAHILLTDNPPQNPQGDFMLQEGFCRRPAAEQDTFTYTGMGLFQAGFFANEVDDGKAKPLAPLLYKRADAGLLSGSVSQHEWSDIGTPQRLQALQQELRSDQS